RDRNVTGVQTCALPIYGIERGARFDAAGIRLHLQALDDFVCDSLDDGGDVRDALLRRTALDLRARRAALDVRGVRCAEYPDRHQIGRASCRERGECGVV